MTVVRTGTFAGQREELVPVLAGQVGHRADLRSCHRSLVGEGGDVAHVDPGADDRAARGQRLSACGTSAPAGAKMIAASSGSGGTFVAAAGPRGAEPRRELLVARVARRA